VQIRSPLLAVAALALLTACDSASVSKPGPAAPARAIPSSSAAAPVAAPSDPGCTPTRKKGPFTPLDAAFTSGSDGWLLAVVPNSCDSGGTIEARTTADGGLHWSKAAAPRTPWGTGPSAPGSGVSRILFANAEDGWAYDPGLWATHDGGVSWRQVSTGGRSVSAMASTGGSAVAAFGVCGAAGASSGCNTTGTFTVETTSVRGDDWRPVPGGTGHGMPVLAAADGTAYVFGAAPGEDSDKLAASAGPADGSARWHPRPVPGLGSDLPVSLAASAAPGGSLVLACALVGAHPVPTHLYQSADGGLHWTTIATRPFFDGANVIQRTPDGTLFIAGMTDGAELSDDGGRTWTEPASVDRSAAVQGGGAIDAAMTTDADGYAIVTDQGILWLTRDGGQSWQRIPVR
jgi:hypothetical protein